MSAIEETKGHVEEKEGDRKRKCDYEKADAKPASKAAREAVSDHASFKWGCDELSVGYANMVEYWPQHENIYRYTMFSTLGDLKGKRVLDMPCGEGRFTEQIFRSGASSVVAVDIAPKMCEMTVERMTKSGLLSADDQAAGEGKEKKLTTIVANACEPMEPLATPCDAICASFLFEYSTNQAELEMTALNLFKCAASGAPMSVIYVPGTKAKEDIAVVKEILGIEATELTPDIKPGDPVVVNYTSEAAEPFSYTIRYWPVEMVADALRKAGFVDVKVDRLSLNPEYKIDKRGFDLARFVKHTGNRLLTGRKP